MKGLCNRLLAAWRSPYPWAISPWKAVLVPAFIVFLVLYLLEPFGISRIESGKLWVTLGSAGVSMAVSSLFAWVLPWLFPHYYEERDWTLGKEVINEVSMFLMLAVCVCLYVAWISGFVLSFRLFFSVFGWVLILGAFPLVLFVMWNRNILLARHLHEAVEMNRSLSRNLHVQAEPENSGIPNEAVFVFMGGAKNIVEIKASVFLYAESGGNYVRLHYFAVKDGQPVSTLLRLTMKQAEKTVSICPYVVRCHRAFLVNVRRVIKVDGNSQGYRLRLKGCADEVPVSRAYAKAVRALIETSNI